MSNNTGKQIDKQELKSTPETPLMPIEEMKKFISILTRADEIQGNYAYNGLLFFPSNHL